MEFERRAGQSDILDMLDRIHSLQLQQAEKNGEMESALAVHTSEIKGLKATDTRQWWVTMVSPFLVVGKEVGRAIINHMGVKL